MLLQMALARERERGCRFLYYIYVDEHMPAMRVDPALGPSDGIDMGIPPQLAFRQQLLEWNPAVGVSRYQFHPVGTRYPMCIQNFDASFVALHYTAARLLLPLYDENELVHWYNTQAVFDQLANVIFLEHTLHFRTFITHPKIPHSSGSTEHNQGKTFDFGTVDPYITKSVVTGGLLARRQWPFIPIRTIYDPPVPPGEMPNVPTKAPPDVRYDINIAAYVHPERPLWLFVNDWWLEHGGDAKQCGGYFCDTRSDEWLTRWKAEAEQHVMRA